MTGIVSLPQVQAGLLSGDPVSYLAGTGHSGPRGIEAFFEYNGAYLNIHDWLDTFIIQSIDGLNDADVRDAREVNPGRHGETAFDAYYGGRTLVLNGKIRASSIEKLRDMQQGLRQIFTDLSQERPLIIRSGDINSDLQIYCRKNQPLVMAEAQADKRFERAFQVTLRASNPRFTSFIEVVSYQDWSVGGYTSPVNATAFTVNNNGNFPAQPIFRITGPLNAATNGGPAARLKNANTASQQQIIVNAKSGTTVALAAGRSLEIDIANRTMKEYDAAGVYVSNDFSQLDTTSDWIELQPGQNPIEMQTYAAPLAALQLRHRHTYM